MCFLSKFSPSNIQSLHVILKGLLKTPTTETVATRLIVQNNIYFVCFVEIGWSSDKRTCYQYGVVGSNLHQSSKNLVPPNPNGDLAS